LRDNPVYHVVQKQGKGRRNKLPDRRNRSGNSSTTFKVDAPGRIVLPAEARQHNHIAEGDTVIITEDAEGLTSKTRDKVLSDAQAYFVKLAPASVSLSEELLEERRSEAERD